VDGENTMRLTHGLDELEAQARDDASSSLERYPYTDDGGES
jgi:hypothetical protein